MHIVNNGMKRRLEENMAENDISFKRYSAALDSLKENDGLIVCLQLKNCQINDERLSELFLAMEHSETVTSIDLSDNLITDDGVLFLSKLLKGGGIQSLIYLDLRGNLITSRTYELLDEIQNVRKILKIYYDSDISSEGLSGLDEDVDTERAINLYRSRWSAACTDNDDNWLLSKSRICDQSVFKLKDKAILSVPSTTLFWHLLKDACLPYFLAREGTKCSGLLQGRRPSYSGHIFALSRTLKDLEENDKRLKAFLMENVEWRLYVVQDGPFQKMQAEQSGDLCGPKPVLPRLVTNFLQNPTRNLVQVNQFTV